MSVDKKMYDVFKGLLSGKQVSTLSSEVLLSCVAQKSLSGLGNSCEVYVLHDPSSIRKPESSSMEYLDKVHSLKGGVVNGYQSMNSIAVHPFTQQVHLLAHRLYSSNEPTYLSQKDVKDVASLDEAGKALLDSATYINTQVLYKDHLRQSSSLLKSEDASRQVCHIADREFDDASHFAYIDDLGDSFVTRLKLSRLSNERKTVYTATGKISKKVVYKKLIDKGFAQQGTYQIAKLTIKNKTYQQVTCYLEWEPLKIGDRSYNVVRITLKQGNKTIFAHPMLLITNREVKSLEQAKQIYTAYILRFKIEIVFKFLKQELGWESFQIQDFNSIKNIVALAFFLLGYFKELEDELKDHPTTQTLAQLAQAKGKITLYYLMKGLKKLAHFQEVRKWMNQNDIDEKQVEQMIQYLKTQTE